jgi:hypothetical protein
MRRPYGKPNLNRTGIVCPIEEEDISVNRNVFVRRTDQQKARNVMLPGFGRT